MIFFRLPTFSLYWIWVGLFLVYGCNTDPNADIENIDLDIELVRADDLLWNCSKALLEDEKLSYLDAYNQHLLPERRYFYEWLSLDRVIPYSDSTLPVIDSVIANNLGPLLEDSAFAVLLDTVRSHFPGDYPIKEKILPV